MKNHSILSYRLTTKKQHAGKVNASNTLRINLLNHSIPTISMEPVHHNAMTSELGRTAMDTNWFERGVTFDPRSASFHDPFHDDWPYW